MKDIIATRVHCKVASDENVMFPVELQKLLYFYKNNLLYHNLFDKTSGS